MKKRRRGHQGEAKNGRKRRQGKAWVVRKRRGADEKRGRSVRRKMSFGGDGWHDKGAEGDGLGKLSIIRSCEE